jgi:DNA-binding NtrC family response regulator
VDEPWDVLVVDDEPVVREAIRRILGVEGLRVAAAEDARSAIAHPAAGRCRLVLCDLKLPDDSGITVIRRLRAARPELPVVLITGYATAESAAEALAAGACGFLPKPFEESELLAAVRHALQGAGARMKEAIP